MGWCAVRLGAVIDSFTGPWAFLSNFYELRVPLRMSGIEFPTVEHAFQAAKTLDEEARARIAAAPTPARAKYLGRSVGLRHDWEQIKLEVMESCVRAKFTNDEWLRLRLIATGGRELLEGNTWGDQFWGVDARTHAGFNHLGRILMKVRGEINAERIGR